MKFQMQKNYGEQRNKMDKTVNKKKLKKTIKSKGRGKARPYRNELEMRIWTLARTGHHAIMIWIASMVKEPVYLFETLRAREGGDPYATKYSTKDFILRNNQDLDLTKFFVPMPYMRNWTEKEKQSIQLKPKKCLMYSYALNHRYKVHFPTKDAMDTIGNRVKIVGKSKYQFDIIILRDVYNWLASFVTGDLRTHSVKKYVRYLNLWHRLACEGTGEIDGLPFKKVFIKYNQWFTSEVYRKQIAKQLGLKYSDETLNKIAIYRSSFDKFEYQGRAQEMKVLERWQMLDKEYLELCQEILEAYPQVTGLSDEIFGKILDK